MENNIEIGIIKWFDESKGFGIIITADSKEYFIHNSNIIEKPEKILKCTPFVFEKAYKNNKYSAINCRLPSSFEDFLLSLKLLGVNRMVKIEIELKGKSKYGNPYIRKEIQDRDILSYYLFKLLKTKSSDIVKEYFVNGFQIVNEANQIEKLIDYYKITKDRINAILFEEPAKFDELKQKYEQSESYIPKNLINDNLVKEVITDFNNKLSNYQLFKIWQAGEAFHYTEYLQFDDFFDHKTDENRTPFPFNESIILENYHELKVNDIKRLSSYSFSEVILESLLQKLIENNNNSIENLKLITELFNSFKYPKRFFNIILSQINLNLYFEIWSKKIVIINQNTNRIFFCDFYFFEDYSIPEEILYVKSDCINFDIFTRITKLYQNHQVIIERILVDKIDKNVLISENIADFIKSTNLLQEVNQRTVLSKFISSINSNLWKPLIEKSLLKIENEAKAVINSFTFQLTNEQIKIIVEIIPNVYHFNIQKKIACLKMLSQNYLNEFIKNNIENFSDREKLEILTFEKSLDVFNFISSNWKCNDSWATLSFVRYANNNNHLLIEPFITVLKSKIDEFKLEELLILSSNIKDDFFSNLLISKIDFESDDFVFEVFNNLSFNESQKKVLCNKIVGQSSELSIYSLLKILNKFIENNISFNLEQFNLFSNRDFSDFSISDLIDFLNTLTDKNYEILENLLISYIENKSDFSIFLYKLIPKLKSLKLLRVILQKETKDEADVEFLEILKNNSLTGKLDSSFIFPILHRFINKQPVLIIEIALIYFNDLYNKLAQNIFLTQNNVIDFFNILPKYQNEIKLLMNSENDLNFFASFFWTLNDFDKFQELNSIFKKYHYGFQSIILKLIIFRYSENEINQTKLLQYLNSIEWIELNSKMIVAFIIEKTNDKEALMTLMNNILKSHFKHLSEANLTDESFCSIFSLENIVKKCNGRKSYNGTTFWKGGGISRFYTKGNHWISSGFVENMYCEGRFWKSQPFYYSDTNKPTTEIYDFFWCKNSMCAKVNDEYNFDLPFYNWTLQEINQLFKINLDRLAVVHLAGWLNRMQTIFDRLKCNECNTFLRPKAYTPHILGYYAVPLFICVNEKCSCHNKEVRFTHCRGCSKILDSRECTICNNCKWLICDDQECHKCGCGANYSPTIAEYL